jgi:hypothetical protein
MEHQLELLLVGSTFKRINISDIKALSVLVPPKHEQDAVCEFLDSKVATHETVIMRLECEIKLLREFRTRLVADVVAGKLDVRGVEVPSDKISEDIEPLMDSAEEVETDEEELVEETADAD